MLAVDEIAQQRVIAEGDVTVISSVNTACVVSSVANTISLEGDQNDSDVCQKIISALCKIPSHQVFTHSIVILFPPHWKQAVTKLLDNHCLILNPPVAKWETVLMVSVLLIVFSLDKEPRYLPDMYKEAAN